MAQIKAWMKSVFNKIKDILNLGSLRVSHQAQNKPPPFDSGQTSQATDSVESPELYLDLATKCMERVHEVIIGGVSGQVKLNRYQCEYLVEKLEMTVASSRKSFSRSSSPEHKAECLETLKLLYQVSTEVERFIQDCCEDAWVQSALLWANMPVRVTSLGSYLELCAELLRNNNKLGSALLVCTKLEGLSQVELHSVTKRASLDRGTLIESLIALSRKSRIKESQLADIILARLTSKEASEAMRTTSSSPSSLPLSQSSFSIANSGITSIKRLKLLGKGSSSSVFKGIWMGAEVAVRSGRGVFANLRRTELDVLESLSHPNIVNVLGYCQDDAKEDISIVLELMDEDLFSLINRRTSSHNDGEEMKIPFTIAEAVDLMLQVAEGVNYFHQNRIIHRDLKSHHILVKHIKGKETKIIAKVSDNWTVKSIQRDFTIAYVVGPSSNRWDAPEVHHDFKLLSFKSDVYSFAMLCYEILTGDVPFSNISSLVEVRRRVLEGGRPMLPAQCPEDLKSLIEICWASKAEQRPSFSEICEELRYLKCLILLEPFNQIRKHQHDRPIAILDLPGLSHFKIGLSCLYREMQLGKGGSETTVYSAYWRPSDKVQHLVAQKRFIGANNEEFKKEITILASLKHHNVVGMVGYATDTRSCSIIMEKMDGDLRDLMCQRRFQGRSSPTSVFAMDEAIYIMLQIAQGMRYVHLENVAHRDLKTCNILVGNSKQSVKHLRVKVSDFGISEKKSEAGDFENVSYNVGTLRWMAPEVIRLKNGEDIHVDSPSYDLFKCDVYSFAMVCFEILTEDVPFAHINLEDFHENQVLPLKGLKHNQIEVLKKTVLDGERPLLPEYCPPKLKTLIESCWNGDARARPSFGEICKELQDLL